MPSKTNPLNIVQNESLRRPEWLRVRLGSGRTFSDVRHLIDKKTSIPFVKAPVAQTWENAGPEGRLPLCFLGMSAHVHAHFVI